jgi:hypothetical protein
LHNEKVRDKPSIRQVPPDHERDLLLPQLLDGDLQRVRLVLQVHQHRRILAIRPSAPPSLSSTQESARPGSPNLQRPRPQHPRALVLGHVRRRRALVVRDPARLDLLDRVAPGLLLAPAARGGRRGGRGHIAAVDDVPVVGVLAVRVLAPADVLVGLAVEELGLGLVVFVGGLVVTVRRQGWRWGPEGFRLTRSGRRLRSRTWR